MSTKALGRGLGRMAKLSPVARSRRGCWPASRRSALPPRDARWARNLSSWAMAAPCWILPILSRPLRGMALFLPGRRDAARARRMLEPMDALVPAHLDHTREWARFDYCYPVISRRSGGVSLGVNLNPDKRCNFNCVYCEVDRCTPPRRKDVDLHQLVAAMAALMDLVASGELFARPPF